MNKKGFVTNIAVIIVAVVVIAGGVWLSSRWNQPVISENNPAQADSPLSSSGTTPTVENNSFADWQIYQNDKYGIELKYPPTWQLINANDLSLALALTFEPEGHRRELYFSCLPQPVQRSENAVGIGNDEDIMVAGEKVHVFGKTPDPDGNYGPNPIGFSVYYCGVKNCLKVYADYDTLTEEDRGFLENIRFPKGIDSWTPASCSKG